MSRNARFWAGLAFACLVVAFMPVDAMAQAVAAANIVAPAGATSAVPQADGTVIFIRPIVDALQPYIIATLSVVIPAFGAWIVSIFQRKTNIQISNDQKDRLLAAFKNAAQTQAGVIFAKLDAQASTISIDVGHPLIANAVNTVLGRLPAEAAQIGMTPDKLADMVAGEIGKLQATATLAPPSTPAKG